MNRESYEAVSAISEAEWHEIALDLERYALSISRNLRWRTRSPVELPGGETATSIVSKAIEKLFSGAREWDPQKEPDIRKYLRGVIDSLLNHLAESKDNVLVCVAPEPGSADYPAWESGSRKRDPAVDWLIPPNRSPETAVLQKEQNTLEDRALQCLLEECGDDWVLMKVLEAMMDGYDKPAEIAQEKGIPITEVYNAFKRLDRKLELVRGRLAQENATLAGVRKTT